MTQDSINAEILLSAAWVAPMTGPVIPDAGIVIRGDKIVAVDSIQQLKKDRPQAIVQDMGNAVILPGLINAHTHLELSLHRTGDPPVRFVDWILRVMGQSVSPDGMAEGIRQCIRFGVTSVGDITSQPAVTRPVLAASGLSGISFGEVRAMAQRRGYLSERLTAASASIDSQKIAAGISPHAPYSIEVNGYRACLASAKSNRLMLATHLAEPPDEAPFLADHSGPLRELWESLGAWDHLVPKFAGGPIRYAKSIGLLDYPTLLAHVNYCDDDELRLLADGQASVVYCPRTHDYFGHPPHRWRDMLAKGINVAIGTDSCASSPDLNILNDLRLLQKIAPEVDALNLFRLATTNSAKALGLNDVGRLEPGAAADFAIFPICSGNPLQELLETNVQPLAVWIAGSQHP